MNQNQLSILQLIVEALNAGTVALPTILNAYNALKAESGMSDDDLAGDIEARGAGLDAKVLARLRELVLDVPIDAP